MTRHAACGVCRTERSLAPMTFGGLDHWSCRVCGAMALDPRHHPSREAEHRRYLQHRNDPDDPAYRHFLARLADPLLARLPPGSIGLDYGCGPGPALASMLREEGHVVALYDPFFHPDADVLGGEYDFVTCTEVVEHFHRPAEEFDRLFALVAPGGCLAIMTAFRPSDEVFPSWHYRRDPTHVVFYRGSTFEHLAGAQGWRCDVPAPDVALLSRPS